MLDFSKVMDILAKHLKLEIKYISKEDLGEINNG